MIEALALYLLSPLSLSFCLAIAAGLLRIAHRRRAALVLACAAFAVLWLGSMPLVGDAMVSALEREAVARAPEAMPAADAILVLGGAVAGAKPPQRPTISLGGSSTRVLYAAELYRAGKAPWIVIAGGNRPEHAAEQVEADAIAELLVRLGVPSRAIVRERSSRTTRENAANVLPLLRDLHAHRVLFVTSGTHMRRALRTFSVKWPGDGPELIPAPTDVRGFSGERNPLDLWLPSLDALNNVTRCLKEFAGLAAIAIIQ